ncbi:substrate-binding domain-containing protein, partial [candidate division KSB3 bacterium]|nr:substrate-binding domain-containing protein [candidate division KSB3 bacterium]MBD3326202.1 substrate-binding domain-containing protein [candidate division KSB3 bacterium]
TSQRVAGILLCSTGLSGDEIRVMVPRNIEVIMLDEEIPDFGGDIVIGDDLVGGYLGAEYLYGLGHERILIIKAPESLSSCQNRLNGFRTYAHDHEKFLDTRLMVGGDFSLESGYDAVKRALARHAKFTAIFSFNDLMAIGAIKALYEQHYRVPEDISVLGYDNIFIDELVTPRITTVATPLEALGKLAVKKLVHNTTMKDRQHGTHVRLKPKLIIRDSCGAPSQAMN